jgi:hypothetical protein
MVEPVTALVVEEVVTRVVEKAVEKILKTLKLEIDRIYNLIQDNARADLYAALDQTASAALLTDKENQRLHLNLAIAEYNKALRRSGTSSYSAPERYLARFGKVLAYRMLGERPSAESERLLLVQEANSHAEQLVSIIRASDDCSGPIDFFGSSVNSVGFAGWGELGKKRDAGHGVLPASAWAEQALESEGSEAGTWEAEGDH